jgi:hypothetical protein
MAEERSEVKPGEHLWVHAATIPVNMRDAAYGNRRGVYRVPANTKVNVHDTYCEQCRKPYNEVSGKPCILTPWIHGGPIGTRKPRNRPGAGGPTAPPRGPGGSTGPGRPAR